MSESKPVTLWVKQLRRGDQTAASPIFECYQKKLLALAREKLGGVQRRAADEEDAVQSAMRSFFARVEGNRFEKLEDRDDLWKLLVTITACKCCDQIEHEGRKKRGGGKVLDEAALDSSNKQTARSIEQVFGREPSPADAVIFVETHRIMLELLPNDLRQIAIWRQEGYSTQEIAKMLKCVVETVRRKLRLIRDRWEEAGFKPNLNRPADADGSEIS